MDWGVTRENFYLLAREVRDRFDEAAHLDPDSAEAAALLAKGEARIVEYTHPDAYVIPAMPGGSKFMRNPPPPLEAVFPDGIPEEANVVPQTVEGVQVKSEGDADERILIDFSTKSAR